MTTLLAIETSCDETAAAVVEDGRRIKSNVVFSQEELHRRFGGVVPELASRQHLVGVLPAIEKALAAAGLTLDGVEAMAVTYGPGLAGSLLVGVNTAKALALSRGLPLVGVNHLEAHVYANWLVKPGRNEGAGPTFPLLCLVVSGGHSELVLMEGHGHYRLLGRTRDDAAGEAFDKVARILGLGYPGGPAIQRAWRRAQEQNGAAPAIKLTRPWLRGSYDFSFSGLKTAMLRLAEAAASGDAGPAPPVGNPTRLAEVARDVASGAGAIDPAYADRLAAAFQETVADVLVGKTCQAALATGVRQIALAGGVAANQRLRELLLERAPVPVLIPDIDLCTDNAAMVGAAGYYAFQRGERAALDLDVKPNLRLA